MSRIEELEQKIKELEAEIELLKVDNKYLQLRLKVELEKKVK